MGAAPRAVGTALVFVALAALMLAGAAYNVRQAMRVLPASAEALERRSERVVDAGFTAYRSYNTLWLRFENGESVTLDRRLTAHLYGQRLAQALREAAPVNATLWTPPGATDDVVGIQTPVFTVMPEEGLALVQPGRVGHWATAAGLTALAVMLLWLAAMSVRRSN